MTSHSDAAATDNDRAAVAVIVATVGDCTGDGAVATVGTVATVGGGVGNGAVVIVTVTNPDDETVVASGITPKSSFPRTRESRTNNPAQPSEFNAAVTDASHPDDDTTVAAYN